MAIERARAHLERVGLGDRLRVLEASSATVLEAAAALGTQPERIAKTLSFLVEDAPVLVVAAGDARVSNALFREIFGTKPRMISADRVEPLVGHDIGGVCPFGVRDGVSVHLDESLRRFDTVFPAGGDGNSAVELTIEQLELASGYSSWVRVCTIPEG